MTINVSVPYNDGFHSNMMLLTLCYYHHGGIRSNDMERFVSVAYDPT